jgi:small subunit ribosomal protein S17
MKKSTKKIQKEENREVTKIQKEMTGIVVSAKMNKTVVVSVSSKQAHPLYKKIMKHDTKYKAHTDITVKVGDEVVIRASRPISKHKRWKVVKILNK